MLILNDAVMLEINGIILKRRDLVSCINNSITDRVFQKCSVQNDTFVVSNEFLTSTYGNVFDLVACDRFKVKAMTNKNKTKKFFFFLQNIDIFIFLLKFFKQKIKT